MSGARIQDHE